MNLILNSQLAQNYKSAAQKARVITEDWVDRVAYCPVCGNVELYHYTNNRPVADFYCENCSNDFELKSKETASGRLGHKITDGAYETMIERITSLSNPNFFFLTHAEERVSNFILIPNHFFTPDIIEKRNPLSSTARRAGWVGCNIKLQEIPNSGKIYIIKDGRSMDKENVVAEYEKSKRLRTDNIEARGWTLDILTCVDRIKSRRFSLKDIYGFEEHLRSKHPDNNFVRDKIRQQLQVLRDKGFLEFLGNGEYEKK